MNFHANGAGRGAKEEILINDGEGTYKTAFFGEVNDNINIGSVIKNCRINLGWTQKHLAKEIGLSREYVSMLEHGKRTLSLDGLYKVAATFGKNASELLAEVDQENKKLELAILLQEITEHKNPEHLKELVTFARKLTLKKQRKAKGE